MIRAFLWERKSWILMFIFLQFFYLGIAFLDAAIPVASILYASFLSSLFFLGFLFFRYQRETRFYKGLEEWSRNFTISGVPEPDSPFENILYTILTEQGQSLKEAASESRRRLDQEKDDLLAWIHEVKTPLTAMHLIMERMENDALKAPLKYEWLRIHLLLDQQLHQKRIDIMENDLYIERIDVEDLLYQEIKTLQSWCIQKGIGFDIDLASTEVLSDSKWLSFVFRQLLTNAVKYSEATDIEITGTAGDQMTLSIRDKGRGIEPQDLPRIFDKGFTSTVHHNHSASTGMGLYLTKVITDSLLIKIEVDSTPGEGSTFTLIFPDRNEIHQVMGM